MVQLDTDDVGLTQNSGPLKEACGTSWQQIPGDWITTLQEMSAVKADWQALEARANGQMTYFQSFDWCYNWCRQFGAVAATASKPQIRIFTVRKRATLAMIWPMMLVADRYGLKKLVFIGEPLTQYGNILVDCELVTTGDVIDAWEEIVKTSDVDVVALKNVPVNSMLGASRRIETASRAQAPTSIMDLSGFADFNAFNASLKKSTRRNRKKRRNKLAGLGEVELIEVKGAASQYKTLVEQALDWKQVWLRETGRTSAILNEPQTYRFLKSLEKGAIALALTVDGKPISIEIGFLEGRHYYSYIGAFDWQLRDYSPGKVQMEDALRWAIEKDVRSYDLLGNPSTYKTDWSNIEVPLSSHSKALTIKGKVYEGLWMPVVRPLLKRAFYRVPPKVRKYLLARGIVPHRSAEA